jgi:hypothetical protein
LGTISDGDELTASLFGYAAQDMEQCSDFFRKNPKLGLESCQAEELIAEALQYKVTRRMLRRMEEEMHIEVGSHHADFPLFEPVTHSPSLIDTR